MKKGFSLTQYSLAAGAILAPVAAFSQAVYTDIDPDIILDEPGEHWGFDLDDDGLNDFNFFNKSFTTTVWYGVEGQVKALFAGVFAGVFVGFEALFTASKFSFAPTNSGNNVKA